MAATTFDIGTLIVHSPDTCGDRPRIAGTISFSLLIDFIMRTNINQ